MRKTVLVAGSAGGGVKFVTDKILTSVFAKAGHEVSSNITYGAAQRSGHVIGDVVLGGGGQHFYADVVLALDQEGFDSIKERVDEKTIVVYDSNAIKKGSIPNVKKAIEFTSPDLRFNNVPGVGALCKVLGVKEHQKEQLADIVKSKTKKHIKTNLEVMMETFDNVHEVADEILDLSEPCENGGYYMNGNEAAVWGALMGGANFYAGYPISPSSEAMHEWSNVCHEFGGVMKQANSEEQAIGMVLGAGAKGGRAWTSTSGPGLSRMLEQIGFGLVSETPFVVYNVQRGGPSTGMPTKTQQSDLVTAVKGGHGDYPMIVLSPSNAQETFGLMCLAMKLTRMYRIGVVVNSSKEVGQRRGRVVFDPAGFDTVDYSLEFEEKRCRTGLTSDGYGRSRNDPEYVTIWLDRLFERFERDYNSLCMANLWNIEFYPGSTPYRHRFLPPRDFYNRNFRPIKINKSPKTVYMGYGDTVPVLEEYIKGRKDTGLVGLLTVHPFPIKMVKELGKAGTENLIILEQNRGVKVHDEEGQLASRIGKYFQGKVKVVTNYGGVPFFADTL